MIDFTTLDKLFKAVEPETWEAINAGLAGWAVDSGAIAGSKMRIDTTVYETNIHYPSDSSLLWDSYRVLGRWIEEVRELDPSLVGRGRLHVKRAKRLFLEINRMAKNRGKTDRRMKRSYRKLIGMVSKVVTWTGEIWERIRSQGKVRTETQDILEWSADEIARLFTPISMVIDQATRRTQHGESVPNDEKIFSIFEEHTRLIKKGKADKPIEFGHVVAFQQVEGKFITGYQVFDRTPQDADLLDDALAKHQELFGSLPESLAADRGFYGGKDKLEELSEMIPHVSIGKKGKRNADDLAREHHPVFKELQKFRAGIEGTISYLKRSLKLTRSLYRSFKTYAASVGSIVFVHNLVVLSRE